VAPRTVLRRFRARRGGPLLFSFNGGAGGYEGMGAGLFEAEPVFRATMEHAAPIVREASGYDPMRSFVGREKAPTKVEDLILLGLTHLGHVELWRSAGVEPDAVLGLSLGEAGAVYAAGGLAFDDAVRVVCAIGDGSREDCVWGALFQVGADREETERLCASAPVPMALAGSLSTEISTVISTEEGRAAARAHIEAHSTLLHEGNSERPTHTSLGASVRDKMLRQLAGVEPRPLDRPCFLASAGRDVSADGRLDAHHWGYMHDHPFLYGEATRAAMALDPALVVQIGAAPHTTPFVEAAARAHGRDAAIVNTMRGDLTEPDAWAQARAAVGTPRRRPVTRPPADPRTVDLHDPEIARDPWPVLAELRRQGPVHHLPRSGVYAVLDPELIQDVLTRPHDFSTSLWREGLDFSLLGAEPEEHGPVRRLVTPLLSPRGVQPLEGLVREVAEEVLRAHAGAREIDVVNALAVPVVHRAIARLLELDEEEVLRCGQAMLALDDPPLRRAEAAFRGLRSPAGIRERLALEEPARSSLVKLLWFAGTVTTVRHIAWSILELGRDDAIRATLRADPSRLDDFLEEMLRVHPPEPFVERIAARDVRLGGVRIPEGAEVAVALGLANRDPERFPDPGRIDLDRRPKGLLTFGAGPHKCPGNKLSRVLAAPTLTALLELAPGFQVLEPRHVLRVSTDRFAHGLTRLLVRP
jgi:cytochrome P450